LIAEEDFHCAIMLERKRTERTRNPFLLMLVDMGGCVPSETGGKIPETVLSALSGFTRNTDVAGWYRENSVLGVMFTEFGSDDRNTLLSAMMTRVGDTLRKNLSSEQFGLISISFHLFPEEWIQ
jgi:hypothetical protein